jgi:hypothetical protein
LEDQFISIKKEFKPHQVLALCLHMYNKGYYIQEINNYYDSGDFLFKDIHNIDNVNLTTFSSTYILNDTYEFKFSNSKNRNNEPKTNIYFKYAACGFTLNYNYKLDYNDYNKKYRLDTCSDGNRDYHVDDEVEHKNLTNNQNKMVINLKFYEEFAPYIIDNFQARTSYFKPNMFSLNYIHNFKTYANSVMSYQKAGILDQETIMEIIDCCDNDMQVGIPYNFKILKFYKNNINSLTITINRTHSVYMTGFRNYIDQVKNNNQEYIESEFNVILPIFKQLGGAVALRSIILEHRIRTE